MYMYGKGTGGCCRFMIMVAWRDHGGRLGKRRPWLCLQSFVPFISTVLGTQHPLSFVPFTSTVLGMQHPPRAEHWVLAQWGWWERGNSFYDLNHVSKSHRTLKHTASMLLVIYAYSYSLYFLYFKKFKEGTCTLVQVMLR